MKNSSLLELFRTFSKKELKEFNEFLLSPYHNKNNIIIKLYDYIKKHAPDFESDALKKETVWKKLYPSKDFNYGVLKNSIFELNKTAENFISHEFFKKSNLFDESLLNSLRERKISAALLKKIISYEKKIEKAVKDEYYLLNKCKIHELKNEFFINRKFSDENKALLQNYYFKHFLLQYLISVLNSFVENNNTGKVNFDFEFLNFILTHYKERLNEFDDISLIKIYFTLVQSLVLEKDKELFNKAYEIFKENKNSMSIMDKKNIYSAFQIFCNTSDRKQDSDGIKYFDILKDMLADKVVFNEGSGKMDLHLYRNFIVMALGEGDAVFMEKFIKDFRSNLESGNEEHVAKYSDAMLLFTCKKYEKCLQILSTIEFNKFFDNINTSGFFKLDVKRLSILCFYELGHYESFFNSCETFRHFIAGFHKSNKAKTKWYQNYIKHFATLVKYKINGDKKNLSLLKKEISEENDFYNKNYLIEEITRII